MHTHACVWVGGRDTCLCGMEVVCLLLVQDFSYSRKVCVRVCVFLCVCDCCVGVQPFPDVIRALTGGELHRHVTDSEFTWKLEPHFLPSATGRDNSRQRCWPILKWLEKPAGLVKVLISPDSAVFVVEPVSHSRVRYVVQRPAA